MNSSDNGIANHIPLISNSIGYRYIPITINIKPRNIDIITEILASAIDVKKLHIAILIPLKRKAKEHIRDPFTANSIVPALSGL